MDHRTLQLNYLNLDIWIEFTPKRTYKQLKNSVNNYAQSEGVYYRFFSIAMEGKDLQQYFPTINYIMVEKLKDFNVKPTYVDKKLPHLNKNMDTNKTSFGN
ncbi:hypothetical protein H5410_041165 [Solanum commersonii]|uniref:Uncharacterized protein n=1 Tax=Solanum commersonii TaxID=4109 RepID=A0A9J5XQT7_SOLCO|nr:hypothetical protein H5410_041165 [Solanum commersonii]